MTEAERDAVNELRYIYDASGNHEALSQLANFAGSTGTAGTAAR